tara:strand:+ start:547 stop:1050 length:504 start_codon:yes stop_codon:yes gene_type:complete
MTAKTETIGINIGIIMVANDGAEKFVNAPVQYHGLLGMVIGDMIMTSYEPKELIEIMDSITKYSFTSEELLKRTTDDLHSEYHPYPPPYKLKNPKYPQYGPILSEFYVVDFLCKNNQPTDSYLHPEFSGLSKNQLQRILHDTLVDEFVKHYNSNESDDVIFTIIVDH